jgi:hypothetical protein
MSEKISQFFTLPSRVTNEKATAYSASARVRAPVLQLSAGVMPREGYTSSFQTGPKWIVKRKKQIRKPRLVARLFLLECVSPLASVLKISCAQRFAFVRMR